jgi:hypothetical protein
LGEINKSNFGHAKFLMSLGYSGRVIQWTVICTNLKSGEKLMLEVKDAFTYIYSRVTRIEEE